MNRVKTILTGEHRISGIIAVLFLVLFSLVIATVPIRADNDCWWHVKSGWYIAEHGLPEHDVFAFTAENYEWHNHEWLTQIAMWGIYRLGEATALGGWRALILAASFVIAGCYLVMMILAKRLTGHWWIALLVAVIAVDVSRRTFHVRPPIVSNLILAGELFLLIGVAAGSIRKRWLAVLPPVFALWTNIHGGWIAGLIVLTCFCAQDIVRIVLNYYANVRSSRAAGNILAAMNIGPGIPLRNWAALFPLCLLGTLCNPYTYHLYELPFRVMGEKELVKRLGELMPPQWMYYPVLVAALALTALMLLTLVCASVIKKRILVPLPPAEWVLYLFFLHQGANHVRHLLLFGIMMVPLTARLIMATLQLLETERSEQRSRCAGIVLILLVIVSSALTIRNWPESFSYLHRNHQFITNSDGYIREAFPADPADFIELVGFEGRMFNENHYAGYLIWRFSPEPHKVFSDPRFDIFGSDILYLETIVITAYEGDPEYNIPSWTQVLDEWKINWMIIKQGTKLSDKLSTENQGWVLVADWSLIGHPLPWQIWIRDTPENEELIQRSLRSFHRRGGVAPS